jgi:hypothetical protein
MDSLGYVYEDAILHRYGLPHGWLANWPVKQPKHIGEVGTVEDLGFNKTGVLSDYQIDAQPADSPDDKPTGHWEFKSSDSIKVQISTDVTLPAWQFIGNAKAGLKIGFGSENGLVLYTGRTRYEALKNLDGLKPTLVEAAQEKAIPIGRSIIVEQLLGEQVLVMGATGHTGELEATTNADIQPGGAPTLASFAVDLKIATDISGSTNENFPNDACLAYRVITLVKKGWLWWRHVAALGASAITPEDALTIFEYTASRDDYFAPLPDAFPEGDTRTLLEGDA